MAVLDQMIRVYDRTMRGSYARRYYENSGFYNFGYWGAGATSQREASEALVDLLAERLADKGGRLLDVACGLGASTRRLSQTFPPEQITAINVSEAQIADARTRAPGCAFQVMNATRLEFPDDHFDAVTCLEAAFHFDTRQQFLAEAYRVLRPGGSLAMSDILFRKIPGAVAEAGQVPRANLVADIAEYRRRLAAAGFVSIDVTDATAPCLGGFRRNLARWAGAERRAGRLKWLRSLGVGVVANLLVALLGSVCKTYLLVSARKPQSAET